MATVKVNHPEILTIEYKQEKTDSDYGSCLWARFNFDLKNYDLMITSDCGEYSYGWTPTLEHESFIRLMSRINRSYLLGKISDTTIVDSDATLKNVKEYILSVLDEEEPDFDFDSIEDVCSYSSESEVYNGLIEALKYTNVSEYVDNYELLSCIETTYPYNAQKIVEVFENFIQPKIEKIVPSEFDVSYYYCGQELRKEKTND